MKRVLLFNGFALMCLALPAAAQEAPAPATFPGVPVPPSGPAPSSSSSPAPAMGAPPPIPQAAPRALEPSSGLLWLLAGSGLTAAGAVNLATAPVCTLSTIRSSAQPACLGTSIAFGVGLLAAGVPLLVVGVGKRSAWVEWSKSQRVGFAPAPGGAMAAWSWTF